LAHITHNLIQPMEQKKELQVNKKDIRAFFLILIIPFLLTFILEHFGEFQYRGYGGVSISQYTVDNLTFTTILGNDINENVAGQGMGFVYQSGGNFKINGTYLGKLPYYLKGVAKDIILPLILIVVSFGVYFFKKKFSIKIT